jgi:hypothetical protein
MLTKQISSLPPFDSSKERLLTLTQASEILGISTKTMQRWQEKIPHVFTPSGRIRFRTFVIDLFVTHRELQGQNGKKQKKVKTYHPMSDEEAQAFFNGCEKDEDGNIILRARPVDPED